jgi:hypothetical protein
MSAPVEPIAQVTAPESFSSVTTDDSSEYTEVTFTESGEKVIVSSPTNEQSAETHGEPASTTTAVVPDDSSASLTSEQQLFYQDFLHDFFMACGMPTMAMCYVSVDDSFWDGTDYENPTEVLAGVQSSNINSGR